jgi:hypothetical protein
VTKGKRFLAPFIKAAKDKKETEEATGCRPSANGYFQFNPRNNH